MKQTNFLIQDINGAWQQIGTGAMQGIRPANPELTADAWGPKQATFDLVREPWAVWPEIQAYAPIEAWVAGKLVWLGRVVEAPVDETRRTTSVRCDGIQSHLDDDQYERFYTHTDITKWVDVRSSLDASLTNFKQSGNVSTGAGVQVGWPANTVLENTAIVAVALDLGPGQLAKQITVSYIWHNGTGNGNQVWNVWGSNDGIGASGLNNIGGTPNPGTGDSQGTSTFTISTPCRYLHVGVQSLAGSSITPTDELTMKFTALEVYAEQSYETGSGSNPNYIPSSTLSGDIIVKDAVNTATLLLSADQSQIDGTSAAADFYLPEYAPDAPRTPRAAIENVNAFYDYLTKVDERGRVHFRPRPTTPMVRMGRWGSSTFTDASAGSATEVFNKVIVAGSGVGGEPIRTVLRSSDLPGATSYTDESLTLTDPSFDTAVTHWSDGVGTNTLTRTTTAGEFDTSPAGLRWDSGGGTVPGGNTIFTNSFATAGTFYAGLTYKLNIFMKASVAGARRIKIKWGAGSDVAYSGSMLISNGGFSVYSVSWTPAATVAATSVGVTLEVSNIGYRIMGQNNASKYYIDTITVSRGDYTLVDKRGFVRAHTLDSGFTLTDASSERLGELYLLAHRAMPFKGQGQVVGSTGARDYLSGAPVNPEDLLLMTGELVHFEDRIDPDTGAVGRDGRLVNVTYRPDTDTATFDIDNTRSDFDQLLARVGVKVGQVRG